LRISDFQAGAFEHHYQHKSFTPEKINHPWEVDDPELVSLLDDANRLVGELNAFSQLVPDVDYFIRMHITKEATTSSRIEGTQTNMEEALVSEQDVILEKRDDWREVQNYIEAIHYAIDRLTHFPLSNRLLRDTHKILLQGVRGKHKQPGEFRTSQNWIGISLKHATFIPPHPARVIELMSDLERFIHNDAVHVPHLIRIGIGHYQFETIHPFLDGNGRLGRLFIALYLANFSLLHKPALYLSDFFERNKGAYYDHLTTVRTTNNLAGWLQFFLIGVTETARRSIEVFKAILALKERIEREILPQFHLRRQANARHLMQTLYQTPVISIQQARTLLNVQTNTASALVNDFVRNGLLREFTGRKRNRRFIFTEYVQLFKEQ